MRTTWLRENWTIVASIIIAALLIAGAWYYNFGPVSRPTFTFSPTPLLPALPGAKPKVDRSKLVGKQTFRITQGDTARLKFKEITIDKLDVKPGDVQKLEAVMEPNQKVESVVVTTQTDHQEVRVVLAPASDNPAIYRGQWTVHDTTDNVYHSIFLAQGGGKENKVTLAWSDPCTPPLGGDWTIRAACTLGQTVDGADNGNIIINNSVTVTVPIGYTLAFNSGKTITLNTSGALSLASGTAQVKKTLLWIRDQDNDGYAPVLTDQLAQDTQPTNYQRRNTRTGTNDCYDLNASATPAMPASQWFTVPRGNGLGNDSAGNASSSYDYNCDGVATQQYTLTNACP